MDVFWTSDARSICVICAGRQLLITNIRSKYPGVVWVQISGLGDLDSELLRRIKDFGKLQGWYPWRHPIFMQLHWKLYNTAAIFFGRTTIFRNAWEQLFRTLIYCQVLFYFINAYSNFEFRFKQDVFLFTGIFGNSSTELFLWLQAFSRDTVLTFFTVRKSIIACKYKRQTF